MICIKQNTSVHEKTTFKNILDKRKIEIRNPSKHWTLNSKSCVYIAGETISWRIHEKTRFSKPVDLSSSIDNTNFQRFYKHTKCKISVLFVILHIIIKNENKNWNVTLIVCILPVYLYYVWSFKLPRTLRDYHSTLNHAVQRVFIQYKCCLVDLRQWWMIHKKTIC